MKRLLVVLLVVSGLCVVGACGGTPNDDAMTTVDSIQPMPADTIGIRPDPHAATTTTHM
jgi:hypothetical protein